MNDYIELIIKLTMSYIFDPDFWVFVAAMLGATGKIWHSSSKLTTREKMLKTVVTANAALLENPDLIKDNKKVKDFLSTVQRELGSHDEIHKFIKENKNPEKAKEIVTKMTQPPFPTESNDT